MRLIQHKKEAYWFYRFVSMGYDRWINPLFWTPAMRTDALGVRSSTSGGLTPWMRARGRASRPRASSRRSTPTG